MTNGQRFITAFYLLFYLLPLVAFTWFPHRLETAFRVAAPSSYALWLLGGTYLLFMIISTVRRRLVIRRPWRRLSGLAITAGRLYSRWRLTLALVLLVLAPYYITAGFSGFRYDPLNISEIDSSLLLVMLTMNVVLSLDFFYAFFVRVLPPGRIPTRYRVESFLLALVMVLTANGTASMLLALAAVAYSLAPRLFTRQMYTPRRSSRLLAGLRMSVVGVLCIVGFLIAWILGEMIKNTVTQTQDAATAIENTLYSTTELPNAAEEYGLYLISAVSSYYHSLVWTSEMPFTELTRDDTPAIAYPLGVLVFRFDYLARGLIGVPRPEIVSLSRLNYLNVSDVPLVAEREGSSPGVIASFTYVFPFPFNLIFCALYLYLLSRIIDVLLSSHVDERLSLVGVMALLISLMAVLQSPFDLLALFDPVAMFVVGIFGMYLMQRQALVEVYRARRARSRARAFDTPPAPLGPPLPAGPS